MTEIDIDAIIKEGDEGAKPDTSTDESAAGDNSDNTDDSDSDNDTSDDTDTSADDDDNSDSNDDSADDDNSDSDSDDSADSDSDSDDGAGDSDDSDDSSDSDDSQDDLNPDTIVLDINGEEVSVTELETRYHDAIAKGKESHDIVERISENEFLMKFNDFVLDGGDPAEYLQKTAIDYDKKSDLELIRESIDEENSSLDDDIKKTLYNRELLNKYSIDLTGEKEGISEDDIKIGEALLKRDASKLRTGLKKSQEDFKLPDNEKVLSDKAKQEQENTDKWNSRVDSDESVVNFLETGMIQIGAEDNPYNFEVTEPESHVNTAKDQSQFFKKILDKSGNVDLNLWLKLNAYASDPTGFENSLVEHGASGGEKKVLTEKKKISSGKGTGKAPNAEEAGNLGMLHAFRDRGVKS